MKIAPPLVAPLAAALLLAVCAIVGAPGARAQGQAPTAAQTPAAQPAAAPQMPPAPLQTLRGTTPIDRTTEPDMFKMERDQPPIPREFVQQPPLIPHSIRGYQITANFNKCMDCHAWSKVKETGATKVSGSHFKDANGRELANISPRRYFCNGCHVPQTDVKPLVANTYKPLPQIAPAK